MADKKEIINNRRINDQAALLQNIDILKNADFLTIQGGPLVNGISFQDTSTTINKLYNFKNFILAYNQLTAASLSALIPYIQIWKIYEDGSEYPIPFNNFYPKSAVESITSTGSDRGYQANLVSLDFISQGKDIATTFIYQVKMNIIFDSVQTLFDDKSRYIELFNPPKKERHKRGNSDPKYYQIKLKFGWDYSKDLPADLKPQQLKAFADASGTELFLNYIIHKLTFNEDGSVALQVEYVGSLESMARNSEKLTILGSKKTKELDDISEKIEIIKERLEKDGLRIDGPIKDDAGNINVKILKENEEVKTSELQDLKRLYQEQSSKETNNKTEFINGILNKIQQQYNGTFPQLKISTSVYTSRDAIIKNYSSFSEVERLKKIEQARDLITKNKNPNNVIFEWNVLKTQQEKIDFNLDNYLKQIDNPPGGVIQVTPGSTVVGAGGGGPVVVPPSYYTIPFFTFGRLLKALDQLGPGKEKKESDYLILCSNCDIAKFGDGNFLNAKDLANNPKNQTYIDNGLVIGDNLAVLKNEVIPVNILQIPIAITTFTYWVNNNITSQNLTQINLINFLNSTIMDLLNLAVKPANQDYVPAQNIQFKFFFDKVEFNNDDKFLKIVRQNQGRSEILSNSTNGFTSIEDFIVNKQINSSNSIKKNLIIFYTNSQYVVRKSDFKADLNDGIPHLFYGQNKGIINKITFREESMPFVREANIQTQVDKKPWKAGVFLRGKYNVIIEMLGTVSFRIGSMIYVSPSFPGVISYDDPIQYGIGGYFVIVSIKSSIESGKYITTLEANWVATGTGEYTNLNHLPFKVIKLQKSLAQYQSEQKAAEQEEKRQKEAEADVKNDAGWGAANSGGGG